MAIGAGSIVMLKGLAGDTIPGMSPVQGVVVLYADPACTVLWSSGQLSSTTIPKTMLSEIEAASADNQAMVGKRVVVAGKNAAGSMLVLAAYSRDDSDVLLGQTENGAYRELTASAVEVVP